MLAAIPNASPTVEPTRLRHQYQARHHRGDRAPSANKGNTKICSASAAMARIMAARKRERGESGIWSSDTVETIIQRDQDEKLDYGQRIRDTFYLADVFVELTQERYKNQLERFLGL